tara:strand:+ start:271 stop:480 length:210 start_codon:yes stop_codon:yes gene_type:complete
MVNDDDLYEYLVKWSDIGPETGLSAHGDQLSINACEAMIAAFQTFNRCGLTFRAELLIVIAIIAWTYLL